MENEFWGDYHTHTFYSDAVLAPLELTIRKGIKLGFKQIAITDHSYSNFSKSLSPKKVIRQHKKIDILQKKYPQIKILKGIEANILDEKGSFDLSREECKKFDVINLGFHRYLKYRNRNTLDFQLYNGFYSLLYPNKINTEKRKQINTDSYIEIIKKYPISTLAHINNCTKVNPLKLALACEKYGTYLEINRMHFRFLEPFLDEIVTKTNCMFIVNSDAHSFFTVGGFSKARKFIESGRLPTNRIANYKKLPEFRSTK
ncbi:MAG: PHP domain-containing protein [Clostridia bacterium]